MQKAHSESGLCVKVLVFGLRALANYLNRSGVFFSRTVLLLLRLTYG